MSKIKLTDKIPGPDGQMYVLGHLKDDIVHREMVVRKAIAKAEALSALVEKANKEITGMIIGYLDNEAKAHGVEWQGSTILKSFDGSMQVEVEIKQLKSYSEQINTAGEIIRQWLDQKLAMVQDKSLKKTFEQVSDIARTALRIDAKGKVDQQKLLQLKKFKFEDEPKWDEAMTLISDAEQITGTKRYIRFKKANDKGKLEGIPVNFFEF